MTDKTQPLPAPEGWRWELQDWGFGFFDLALVAPHNHKLSDLYFVADHQLFKRETQIRRTSKKVLRIHRDRLAREAMAERLKAREF